MALNIADLFEHAADAVPERLAIACGDAEVTYRELEGRSNQLAHYLSAAGVGPGDHVGVYGRNSIELVAAFLRQIGRTPAGKAGYRWARQYAGEHVPATSPGADVAPAQGQPA
jgi:non-ribosomal peptide synthetase component F